MKIIKNKLIYVTFLLMCLILSACSKNAEGDKTAETAVPTPTPTVDVRGLLEEEIGSTPNAETSDQGSDQYVYQDVLYLDYTGDATYYFTNGVAVFYQWETTADNKKGGKKIYQDVIKNEKKEYSKKGKETKDGTSFTYSLADAENTTTINLTKAGKKYKLIITKTGKNLEKIDAKTAEQTK